LCVFWRKERINGGYKGRREEGKNGGYLYPTQLEGSARGASGVREKNWEAKAMVLVPLFLKPSMIT
jgi:hypothetical protein